MHYSTMIAHFCFRCKKKLIYAYGIDIFSFSGYNIKNPPA